ncbi:unnamed protein product [Protopolystoma xenopodis]|uniref:HECT domain-containing protein n=1 Tax=Protopolystoma xenopodis TaxID=117903 RepID=A0A448WQG9_9PLAT|nr:unnamed protein product [Protopolystoma xenopodis]
MLRFEAQLTMRKAAACSTFFGSFLLPTSPSAVFAIEVRRNALVEDTLTLLSLSKTTDLRKPLRVKFHDEEAVDEGGVLKEFFLLIMREILDPIYGMFRLYPESRMIWFSDITMETESIFRMVGLLCGLAIYNSILVDLSFPLALFRKLLGETSTLEDLKELDPVLGRSLLQLIDYEESDFENVFGLFFEVNLICL